MPPWIITPSGEKMYLGEVSELAKLIYKRFGRRSDTAAAAWDRLFEKKEGTTTPDEFLSWIRNSDGEIDVR